MLLQSDNAKAAYWQQHGAKESSTGRNKGAHLDYLEKLLSRNSGGSGYVVGDSLTAADLCVWEIVDLHLRIFKEQLETTVSSGTWVQGAFADQAGLCSPGFAGLQPQ